MIDYSFSYGDLEIFLLIVVRIMTFIYVCPFFGGNQTPRPVKVGYGLMLSILLYGAVPFYPPDYNTVVGYAVIVLKVKIYNNTIRNLKIYIVIAHIKEYPPLITKPLSNLNAYKVNNNNTKKNLQC